MRRLDGGGMDIAPRRRRGMTALGWRLAASSQPQARVLAEARGYTVVEVDYDELRGIQTGELRLF